jgi:hypothetical protein
LGWVKSLSILRILLRSISPLPLPSPVKGEGRWVAEAFHYLCELQ